MDASYESILTILQKMYIKYREDKDEEIVGFNTTVELVKVDDSELCQLPPYEQKYYSRSSPLTMGPAKVAISRYKNNVLIAHYSAADLSMFSDFSSIVKDLDIVSKSFITLGNPLTIDGNRVHVRDTFLLVASATKSISLIGKTHGFDKISLSQYEIQHMDVLLKSDPLNFEAYALRDALISLKHASWIEEFNFINVKRIGIPVTLASLGKTMFDQPGKLENTVITRFRPIY